MANGWDERELSGRAAAAIAAGGGGVAVVSAALAAATGDPYLEGDGVNPWIVVFSAGLMAALIAFPFSCEVRLRGRYADRDKRWEVSLVAWGALSAVLLVAAFAAGFDSATLGGALGLIVAIEAAIVAATVAFWLLAGG